MLLRVPLCKFRTVVTDDQLVGVTQRGGFDGITIRKQGKLKIYPLKEKGHLAFSVRRKPLKNSGHKILVTLFANSLYCVS